MALAPTAGHIKIPTSSRKWLVVTVLAFALVACGAGVCVRLFPQDPRDATIAECEQAIGSQDVERVKLAAGSLRRTALATCALLKRVAQRQDVAGECAREALRHVTEAAR